MPRVMLVAGGCFLPRDSWDQEGGQRRAGSLMSGYPGVPPPPQGLPWAAHAHAWDQGAGHRGELARLDPNWLRACCKGSSPAAGGLRLQPRPRPRGHGQRAAGHRAGRRRSLPPGRAGAAGPPSCPFSGFWPFPLAPARPLGGCCATLGSQVANSVGGHTTAEGVPRDPRGLSLSSRTRLLLSTCASDGLQVAAQGGVPGHCQVLSGMGRLRAGPPRWLRSHPDGVRSPTSLQKPLRGHLDQDASARLWRLFCFFPACRPFPAPRGSTEGPFSVPRSRGLGADRHGLPRPGALFPVAV